MEGAQTVVTCRECGVACGPVGLCVWCMEAYRSGSRGVLDLLVEAQCWQRDALVFKEVWARRVVLCRLLLGKQGIARLREVVSP